MSITFDKISAQIFFTTIFGTAPSDTLIELRPINAKKEYAKAKYVKISSMREVIDSVEKDALSGECNCFYGVLPRTTTQGCDNAIDYIQTFWVDLDAKHFNNDKLNTLKALDKFALTPTIIVDSGHGYHAYWVLKSCVHLKDDKLRQEATSVSKALHRMIGADATFNISRILRVPGTMNIKDPDNPLMCKLHSLEVSATYTFEDIKSHVDMSVLAVDEAPELDLTGNIDFSNIEELSRRVPEYVLARAKTLPIELQSDRSANDFWVAIKLFEAGLTDAEVLAAFKLFAAERWSAGEKVRQGVEYLIKHTLPQAKLRVNSLEKIFDKISAATMISDKLAYAEQALELILDANTLEQQSLLKKLHTVLGGKDVITLPALKNQLAYLKSKRGPGKFFDVSPSGGKTFVPRYLGEFLLSQTSYMFLNSTLYRYAGGVFKPDGEEYASSCIQQLLEHTWKTNYRDEVISWIKDTSYITSEIIEANAKDELLVNVKNGMLNVLTGELKDHAPEYRSLAQLNVYYNAEAVNPRLDQFMSEVFTDDAIKTLWEFCGYILLEALEMKKFIIFTGKGNNGKSIWLNLINNILGEENVVNEPLQKLANSQFSTANLHGKLANINADLESDAIKYTGIIKMLTGGDKIAAEVKYGDTFYFKNRARMLFSCNELPPIHDYNDAFFDRLFVVNCPNQFTAESGADPFLMQKLLAEEAKSAWLNRAVEGAKRLYTSKQFTPSESITADVLQYRYSSDTVTEFIQSNIRHSEGSYVSKDEMYVIYKMWCRDVGRYPCSLKVFTKRAQAAPNNLIQYHPKTDDGQISAWKDIALSDIIAHKYEGYRNSSRDTFSVNIK